MYFFDTIINKQDYLLDYLSIISAVSNNNNVGMGNNSQSVNFTISSRINSLVIHSLTVERNRRWQKFHNKITVFTTLSGIF